MEDFTLSVDIGTTSLKMAIISNSGNILARTKQKFNSIEKSKASYEWEKSFINGLNEFKNKNINQIVKSICVSGNGPTIISENGTSLLWNENIEELNLSYQGTSLFIPRLLAFKKKYKKEWNESKFIFSGPEYFLYVLSKIPCTILPQERFLNAYWTRENLIENSFDDDEIKKLPEFRKPAEIIGSLKNEKILEDFENIFFTKGTKVITGAPDFVSALVGTNTLSSGKICDRAGSSEGLNLCINKKINFPGLRLLPSIIDDLWNVSILLPQTGSDFSELKKSIEKELDKTFTYKEFVAALINNDGKEALLDQGLYFLIQTALKIRESLNTLKKAANENQISFPDNMTSTGGQASNLLWTQMKSDITKMKINIPLCEDAELIGNAIFAFTALGFFNSIKEGADSICKIENVIEPNVQNL